jgi:hypothetical protein
MGMARLQVVHAARSLRTSEPRPGYSFLNALYAARSWKCSNCLDKIYGLLGLAEQSLQDELSIDYGQRPADLYLAFAKYWIPKDLNLKILNIASHMRNISGLPTWCPNFDSFQVETPLWIRASEAQYHAGFKAGDIAHGVATVDSRELRVKGFSVDEIEEVLPCPWEVQEHTTDMLVRTGIALLVMWESKCLELSKRAYSPESEAWDAHWRTLIANKKANGEIYPPGDDGREAYDLLRIKLGKEMTDQVRETQSVTDAQNPKVADYALAFGYACHGRSFFSTTGGRSVGLGPRYAKRGDMICIFHNGVTPFIVRPGKEDPNGTRNEFVGECYVHGLMYGEALEKEIKRPDTTFILV